VDVSDDDDWLHCFGVLPQEHSASDEEWVRELTLYVSDTERVLLGTCTTRACD
jgi:hypothetical protein